MDEINTQPFSKEAEEAVLGSLLLDPVQIQTLHLSEDDYYIIRNKWIFESMKDLYKDQGTFDLLTITDDLNKKNQLEEICGQPYLIELVNKTPSAVNIGNYAEIVREKKRRRSLLSIGNELAKIAYQEDVNIEDKIPLIMTALTKNTGILEGAGSLDKALSKLYDDVIDKMKDPKDIYGIPTGLIDLDYATGGMQTGELNIIAGDPGIGKSILLAQMMYKMADHSPGVFYEMEMSAVQTMRRLISNISKVMVRPMRSGRIDDGDLERINEAIETVSAKNIYFSDYTQWTTLTLRADLARLKQKHNIQWFGLDYLYLLQDNMDKPEHERLGRLGADLKKICKDLDISGVAIHSLTKSKFGERTLGDVRGSYQLVYEADTVFFLEQDTENDSLVKVNLKKFREDTGGFTSKGVTLRKKTGYPMFTDVARGYQPEDVRTAYKEN